MVDLAVLNDFIESEIRPLLVGDGGDLEFLELTEENILVLRIEGQCVNCASLPLTVTFAIESRIKERFPEIKGVLTQTEENTL